MNRLKSSLPLTFLRGALVSALASVTLLGSGAWAQKTSEEEPVYKESILEEGYGWQVKSIQGTTLDEATGTFQPYDERVISVKPEGLREAPIAGGVTDELVADTTEKDTVFTLNQRILEEIDISREQGYLTPALEELVAADKQSGFGKLSGCPDQIMSRSKTLSINTPVNFSSNLGGGFTGSIAATGNMQGSATGEVEFAIKRTKVIAWCVPYGARFNHARAYGSASVGYGANLSGNLTYNYSWETELAKPHLGAISFFVGPVPVYIGFNLPITMGLDVQASVTGSVTYNGSQSATGSFDYTCTLSGCSGSSNYNLGSNSQQTLTGSVSGRVYPNIWVQAAVRAYLYSEWVAYAQVGVRPYLRGDLWGYYGNSCGDADGDGLNETVSALTFDLDWQLYLTGQASAFGSTPAQWNNLWSTPRYHIHFWDLLGGSSALRPMINGSGTPLAGSAAGYSGMMRPCWPYSDSVNYRFDWGDTATTTLNGAAHSWNGSSHTWAAWGPRTLGLTALSDGHGRGLNQTTTRNLQVKGWTGWLNRDAPGGSGDYETLTEFVSAGQACSSPTSIQCQTTAGVDWTAAGEVYSCTAASGGVCVNSSQPDGYCQDYRVRFYCP